MRRSAMIIRRLSLFVLALGLGARALAQTMPERLRAELDQLPHPRSVADFQAAPCLSHVNQNKTSFCWSFATCSFLEAEMARRQLPPVRLSPMYAAYCQYVEKARRFVQTRGESRVSPGDTFWGVFDACAQYGAMPSAVYEKLPDNPPFDHTRLYAELGRCLQEVKLRGQWNEARVLARIRKILNRHLGKPPETFAHNGKTYTPRSFLAEVVRLPWSEYISVVSQESAPFNAFTELKVPDNWRHHTNFFNVPLPVFYEAFRGALRGGFTVAVEIDTSEPSYETLVRHCFIPSFDLPARELTQAARETRLQNGATGDDHAIHIIGWSEPGGEDWFLAKDSGKEAWRDGNQGIVFLHGAYVKLKVLAFIVHRDGVPPVKALLPPG